MIDNPIARIILFPVSLLYGALIALRNLLYQQGLLKSIRFSVPVISIGNLSVGGTGKTPHTAHLIMHLKPFLPVAMLSRGYGRKSRGYRLVQRTMPATEVGDEPLLMKFKHPDVPVAVSEDRATGIPRLMSAHPDIKTILLDDAFQHRAVDPYINILLTTYDNPYFKDWLIPSGRLREWPSDSARADIIIVSKCPDTLTETDRDRWMDQLDADNRPVFFTKYIYGLPYHLLDYRYRLHWQEDMAVILCSGIANTDYLMDYLHDQVDTVYNMAFKDHHQFTDREVAQLHRTFDELTQEKKAIICTEKDAVRLLAHKDYLMTHKLTIYVLPIQVDFLFDEEERYIREIQDRLLAYRV